MEFYVNNGRKIKLEQAEPDGPVSVTTWEAPDRDGNVGCESEYTIFYFSGWLANMAVPL